MCVCLCARVQSCERLNVGAREYLRGRGIIMITIVVIIIIIVVVVCLVIMILLLIIIIISSNNCTTTGGLRCAPGVRRPRGDLIGRRRESNGRHSLRRRKRIHPVSVTRSPSFRTQPLENLSHYL